MNPSFVQIFKEYKEISVRYDKDLQTIWYYFNPSRRPCFSLTMLREIYELFENVEAYFSTVPKGEEPAVRYLVLNSQVPGIFNLGGDLELFSNLIREKNRSQLLEYAKLCVKLCYLNAVNLNLPLTTISLVEGTALGGGFESAMASNILIATEEAEMGFPEIRFNLFPGMSAYSFLARTCGMVTAEKMIISGKTYSAQELYDMGIVHVIVESGNAQESVEKYIHHHRRSGIGRRAIQLANQRYHPIDHQELIDITEIWVEAALQLEQRDLKMMDRLVKAQFKKMEDEKRRKFRRTKQDRRFNSSAITFPFIDWSGEEVLYDRRKEIDRRQVGDRRREEDSKMIPSSRDKSSGIVKNALEESSEKNGDING